MAWEGLAATDAELLELWPDAPSDDDGTLSLVLDAAYGQLVEFAPEAPATPTYAQVGRFKLAHAMQARSLYRSSTAGGGDAMGAEGFTVTVFPMDWTVKALLRPTRRPVVG